MKLIENIEKLKATESNKNVAHLLEQNTDLMSKTVHKGEHTE